MGNYQGLLVNAVNGVRQGALSCLLFTVALEKNIRDVGINTRRTIFNKSVQILAYVGDIDIISSEKIFPCSRKRCWKCKVNNK